MYRAVSKLLLFLPVILLSSPAFAERLDTADQFCSPVTGSGSDAKLTFGGKPVSLVSGVEVFYANRPYARKPFSLNR